MLVLQILMNCVCLCFWCSFWILWYNVHWFLCPFFGVSLFLCFSSSSGILWSQKPPKHHKTYSGREIYTYILKPFRTSNKRDKRFLKSVTWKQDCCSEWISFCCFVLVSLNPLSMLFNRSLSCRVPSLYILLPYRWNALENDLIQPHKCCWFHFPTFVANEVDIEKRAVEVMGFTFSTLASWTKWPIAWPNS